MAGKSSSYDWALKIRAQVDPSVQNSAKKASSLISSIVKADLIVSGIKSATSAVKNFAMESVQSFAGFEQSLANTGAIANASASDMKKLEEAAIKAGSTTSFTAAQSADALGYMALAGWDVNTSIQALNPILTMAQATGADLALTSDQVTDSMSAMGIKTEELNDYLNVLVMTNNKSNTTASALMEAMKGAGSAATAAGMNYKQTAAALGVLANNGKKGAEAGTALNSMLMRMTSNKEAINMYSNLGVKVFDAQGNMRDFESILRETDKALSKLDDKKRAKAIAAIAGVNYGGEYQFLLKGVRTAADGSSEWGKLADNINNAGTALQDMNKASTNTMSFAFTKVSSAIDGARIAFIKKFAPQITKAANYLADVVIPKISSIIEVITTKLDKVTVFIGNVNSVLNALGSNNAGFKQAEKMKFIVNYGKLAYNAIYALREVVITVGKGFAWVSDASARMNDFNGYIEKNKEALGYIAIAVGGITTALVAYNAGTIAATAATAAHTVASGIETAAIWAYCTATDAATLATSLFRGAIAFLTGPVGLVITAITALVAAGWYLYNNWDEVCAWVSSAWDATCNFVTDTMNGFVNFCSNVWDSLVQGFNTMGQAIKSAFVTAFTGLMDIVKTPINFIIAMINKVIEHINGISISVPDWVPGVGGESVGFNLQPIPALASGGIVTKPTTALIGEGSESEAVIPLSKLGEMLKTETTSIKNNNSAESNITFAPTININGSADKQEIKKATDIAFDEFKRLYNRLKQQERRINFA